MVKGYHYCPFSPGQRIDHLFQLINNPKQFSSLLFLFPNEFNTRICPSKKWCMEALAQEERILSKKITLHHVCWCTDTQILSGSMLPSLGCCDDSDGLWKSPRDPGVAAKQGKVGNRCNKSRSSGTKGGYPYIQRLALDRNLGQAVKHHLDKK